MEKTFLELCKKVIKEEGKELSPKDMWEIMKQKKYRKKTNSSNPVTTISALLYSSVKNDPNTPFVRIEDGRTIAYSLKSLQQKRVVKDNVSTILSTSNPDRLEERDLHPLLTYHQYFYNGQVFTKTIYHERSLKKPHSKVTNEWSHPDLVGAQFNGTDWNQDIHLLAKGTGGLNRVKLLSFELKIELNESNYRESFFQTVSNSRWANEAYLVALDIEPDHEFRQELKRLSLEHGIGIIELNEDPDNTRIIYQAKVKEQIQYETVNKLYRINPDFQLFIDTINKSLSINEIMVNKFDQFLTPEELIRHITQKLKLRNQPLDSSKEGSMQPAKSISHEY